MARREPGINMCSLYIMYVYNAGLVPSLKFHKVVRQQTSSGVQV